MSARPAQAVAAIFALLGAVGFAACGGTVVFESAGDGATHGDGDGDGDGDGATGATSTGTGAPTTCTDTEDCASDEVCVFATGACRKGCAPDDCEGCGPGFVCEACATSSCPLCKNCVSACLPVVEGRCDDDDPCPASQACDFASGFCYETCSDALGDPCDQGGECNTCQTGSCCGCRDCVDLCVPI